MEAIHQKLKLTSFTVRKDSLQCRLNMDFQYILYHLLNKEYVKCI